MTLAESLSIPPPTIAMLRAQGVTGLRIYCRSGYCCRSAMVGFDAAHLPCDLPFLAVERSGRLVCSVCEGARFDLAGLATAGADRDASRRPDHAALRRCIIVAFGDKDAAKSHRNEFLPHQTGT